MWIAIAFAAGLLIGAGLVWLFAPRPYVDDEIVVETERILADLAVTHPDLVPQYTRMKALRAAVSDGA